MKDLHTRRCDALENENVRITFHGDVWGIKKEKLIIIDGPPVETRKESDEIEVLYYSFIQDDDSPVISYAYYFNKNLLFRTISFYFYDGGDPNIYIVLFFHIMMLIQSDLGIKGDEARNDDEGYMCVDYTHKNTKLKLRYNQDENNPIFYLQKDYFNN